MMTVKVIIERSMSPERQEEAVELLTDLRARAMRQLGYVSGETLFSVDRQGTHVVISTWQSLNSWRSWEHNPERLEIAGRVEALLSIPSKASVYEMALHVAEGA
jgi:antibiotic biosynthesis monooxygenase (ABM) superfamily enzyme